MIIPQVNLRYSTKSASAPVRVQTARPLPDSPTACHPAVMLREIVNRTCATFPGAEHSDPWGGGHDAWKVGGKLFAVVGAREENGLSIKCPDVETAEMLIEAGAAEKAPYLHRSWVRLPPGRANEDEIVHRLDVSYRTIRATLPKKVQAALGEV